MTIYIDPVNLAVLPWFAARPRHGAYVSEEVFAAAVAGDEQARDELRKASGVRARVAAMPPGRPAVTITAVPRERWPLAARSIELLAVPSDQGIGDTLKRCLDRLGGGTLAQWYTRITGKECGCGDRAAKLNALYPYPNP